MTLHFAILSFDRYSRDSLIGEVFFALNEKDVLESIEKEQISVQKDIILRSVKVRVMMKLLFTIISHLVTSMNIFLNYFLLIYETDKRIISGLSYLKVDAMITMLFYFLVFSSRKSPIEENYWYLYVGNQQPEE